MSEFVDLSRLVNPRNVVVVGASGRAASQGRRLFDNLVVHSSLAGEVFAVNPAYQDIGEHPCWPSILDLPDVEMDVALIIVNAALVLDILAQCAERKIPFAIVMTSGFAEAGAEGRALEEKIAQLCRTTGLHVYGPNCPGFVNLRDRLGMTFSPAFKDDLNSGPIGLATQGGGLGRNLLQGLSHTQGVGLWFSSGNSVDLDIPDFIAHMAQDPGIEVIALLIEGIKDGRRLAAALGLARTHGKPVVVLKIGRSEQGIRAAQSHTASLAGTAAINSAVFRQFGAIEVDDLDELLAVARLAARARLQPGAGLCIYTFSGGTAALAADLTGAAGLPLPPLTFETSRALAQRLPGFANLSNPVDTTADIFRDPTVAHDCLSILCADPRVGVVLYPIPMDYGDITDTIARTIVEVSKATDTLIVPVWMSRRLGGGFQLLETAGLMPFFSLAAAVAALKKAFDWSGAFTAQQQLQRPAQTPPYSACDENAGNSSDAPIVTRTLSEVQAKALLHGAGFPIPEGEISHSPDQAVQHARTVGYPVVMKVVSPDILHKTEAGGVCLNLSTEQQVRDAYVDILSRAQAYHPSAAIDGVLVERMLPAGGREVLIGMHRDPAFGPVITVGLGGILVETVRDVVHRMIPLTAEDAHAMIREIKHVDILDGVRGQAPADIEALERLVMTCSAFVARQGDELLGLELNPVWVGVQGAGVVALDALVTFKSDEPVESVHGIDA